MNWNDNPKPFIVQKGIRPAMKSSTTRTDLLYGREWNTMGFKCLLRYI